MRRPLLMLAAALACAAGAAEPAAAPPAVFAPGVISGPAHDAAPAFSPDGRRVWFNRSDGTRSTILESELADGRWSAPRTASFSGRWSDMEPAMSPDGRSLVFVSNRPADGAGKPLDGFFMGKSFPGGGGNLWRVDRVGAGWGTPERLPEAINASASTFAPSLAADGSLWFMRPVDDGRRFRLYRAAFRDGRYEAPQPLPFSDGTATDVDPAVAPDESFVVFGSSRAPAHDMDLFIAHRHGAAWDAPRHLGEVVNSPGSDAEARLSPDGRTLYFSSERRSAAPADKDADWNNGKYNVWSVDLRPWLEPHS